MALLISPRRVRLLLPALLVVMLASCAAWKINSLAEQLQSKTAAATLKALQAIDPPSRDMAQYLLDLGSLKFATGDFTGSIQDLQQAKQIMRDLQAVSISENAAAVTINETLRAYDGSPTERVMVHLLLAWNYLAINDFDGARVEMLQSDVVMQELAKNSSLSGQLASARFMAGIIYELDGEWDDAMISYRRAAAIMKARNQPIPEALAISLLNTSNRQGFTDEYQGYEKQFGRSARPPQAGEGELIVFYSDGVISNIEQQIIPVYSPQLNQMISIATPYYPRNNYMPRRMTLSVAGQMFSTGQLENIELLVREDLDAKMPAILATTMARAVAKYYAVKGANNQDSLAGLLANIATVVTEVADTRSWNMLPSSVQVARLKVPAGASPSIAGMPATSYETLLAPTSQGATVLVMASSLRDNIYSYQQAR